jgi:hypothetical protein
MKFALDQNFPVPLVNAMADFIPPDLELLHVHKLDPAFSELSDADLILALSAQGIDCLITTDYHMLDDPQTVAAMVAAKMNVIVVESAGHDPLRASGALFLELPGIAGRLAGREGQVIYIPKYKPRVPRPAWNYLTEIASKHDTTAGELFKEHRPDEG